MYPYKYFTLFSLCALSACGGSDSDSVEKVEESHRPNAFSLESFKNVNKQAQVHSGVVTLSGLDEPASLSVQNCTYSLNDAEPASETVSVSNGDTLQFWVTAPNEYDQLTECIITLSDFQTSFVVETKKIVGSVQFEFIDVVDQYEEQEVEIRQAFIHSADGLFVEEVDSFEETILYFTGVKPEAYTIVASGRDDSGDDTEMVMYTSLLDETDVDVYLPITLSGNEAISEDCKKITLDASEIKQSSSFEQSIEWVGLATNVGCGGYLSRSTTASKLSVDLKSELNDEVTESLVYVAGPNRNLLGYNYIDVSGYMDGDEVPLPSLRTDFIPVTVNNNSPEVVTMSLWGIVNADAPEHEQEHSVLGRYEAQAYEMGSAMNTIDFEVEEYYATYRIRYGNNYSGSSQYFWGNQTLSNMPNELSMRVPPGKITFWDIYFEYALDIRWEGTDLEAYDIAQVWISGKNEVDLPFSWQIGATNSGEVTIPVLPGFNYPDIYDSRVQLFFTSDTEEGTKSLNTSFDGYCSLSDCNESAYFE